MAPGPASHSKCNERERESAPARACCGWLAHTQAPARTASRPLGLGTATCCSWCTPRECCPPTLPSTPNSSAPPARGARQSQAPPGHAAASPAGTAATPSSTPACTHASHAPMSMEIGHHIPCPSPLRQAARLLPGGGSDMQPLRHQQAATAVPGSTAASWQLQRACALPAAGAHLQAPGPPHHGAEEQPCKHDRGCAGPLTPGNVVHELWKVPDDRERLASRAGGGRQGRHQRCPCWVASNVQPLDQHLQAQGAGCVGCSRRSPQPRLTSGLQERRRGAGNWLSCSSNARQTGSCQCPTSATSGSRLRHTVASVLAAHISTKLVMPMLMGWGPTPLIARMGRRIVAGKPQATRAPCCTPRNASPALQQGTPMCNAERQRLIA